MIKLFINEGIKETLNSFQISECVSGSGCLSWGNTSRLCLTYCSCKVLNKFSVCPDFTHVQRNVMHFFQFDSGFLVCSSHYTHTHNHEKTLIATFRIHNKIRCWLIQIKNILCLIRRLIDQLLIVWQWGAVNCWTWTKISFRTDAFHCWGMVWIHSCLYDWPPRFMFARLSVLILLANLSIKLS